MGEKRYGRGGGKGLRERNVGEKGKRWKQVTQGPYKGILAKTQNIVI